MTKSKNLGLVFRAMVLITAVALFLGFYNLISAVIIDENFLDSQTLKCFGVVVNCYYVALVGAAASLALSCVAQAYCMKISVVVRTLLIGIETGVLIAGFKLNHVLGLCVKVLKNVDDYDALREIETIEELGITEAQAEKILDFAETGEGVEVFMLAFVFGVLAFTILAISSIHWLAKKKKEPVVFNPNEMFN